MNQHTDTPTSISTFLQDRLSNGGIISSCFLPVFFLAFRVYPILHILQNQLITFSQQCIRNWLKEITTAHNNIIQLAPVAAVDSVIKGKMLHALKAAQHPNPSTQIAWMIRANKWSDDYQQNPASITWQYLKAQITQEIAKQIDTPPPAQAPFE